MKLKIKTTKGHMPYQEVTVGICDYWDYNLRINGVVYEISVNKKSGAYNSISSKKTKSRVLPLIFRAAEITIFASTTNFIFHAFPHIFYA